MIIDNSTRMSGYREKEKTLKLQKEQITTGAALPRNVYKYILV